MSKERLPRRTILVETQLSAKLQMNSQPDQGGSSDVHQDAQGIAPAVNFMVESAAAIQMVEQPELNKRELDEQGAEQRRVELFRAHHLQLGNHRDPVARSPLDVEIETFVQRSTRTPAADSASGSADAVDFGWRRTRSMSAPRSIMPIQTSSRQLQLRMVTVA
jgi:hypothetical protein